jgi:hypothetical protein
MYEFMDKRLRHRVCCTGLAFDCARNPDRVGVYVAFAVQVLYFARRCHYNNCLLQLDTPRIAAELE